MAAMTQGAPATVAGWMFRVIAGADGVDDIVYKQVESRSDAIIMATQLVDGLFYVRYEVASYETEPGALLVGIEDVEFRKDGRWHLKGTKQ